MGKKASKVWAVMLVAAVSVMPLRLIAQITTPTDADGRYLPPSEAPCVPFNVGPATGTTEVLVRNSGPGYVAWVMVSTVAGSGYLIMRDTGSLTWSSASELGGTIIFPSSYSAQATGAYPQTNQMYRFVPPVRFTNGIVLRMNTASSWATICTRLYGTQSP